MDDLVDDLNGNFLFFLDVPAFFEVGEADAFHDGGEPPSWRLCRTAVLRARTEHNRWSSVRTMFASFDRLDQWAKKMFIRLGDDGFPGAPDVSVIPRKRRWAQFSGRDRLCNKIHLS